VNTFLNIIFIFGILQGFLFVFYWLFLKKNRIKPIVYLNVFVFFLTLNNIQVLVFINDFFKDNLLFKNIEFSWYLLILPYFITFIIHYFEIEKQEKSYIKPAWFLFVTQLVIRLSIIGLIYFQVIDLEYIKIYSKIEEVINLIVSLYLFYKIYHYIYQDSYSEKIKEYDNILWLKYFFIASCFVIFFWIFAVVLNLLETADTKYMYNPLRISSTVLLYWIAYIGIIKMNLTFDRMQFFKDKEINHFETESKAENFSKDFKKIDDYINKNKRFIDPNFTLERLAIEVQMNRNYLSKLINKHNDSFSEYINIKKVEAAKKHILDEDSEKYTLEVLAYECGFKSKSNFFFLFKKYNQCTPAEWKKQNDR
jgi:AraC-like DNA-binding protein